MKTCPTCQVSYPNNYVVCPADGTQLEEVGTWTVGSIIRGKYRLVAKVGQGGMGSVYKATHLAFDEMRALKVIAPELLSDDLFVKRFKHEAVITRRLQHPNAVRVDDIDEAEDGRPFIVMEFIEGKSLKKLIREEGPLPAQRVLLIIKQAALALDAAHKLGMVHRDIKPDNIALVDAPDGEMVKVLDFGIAKMKEARMGESAGLTLTGAGVVIGTPQYMSPEQAMGKRGDDLDGRADLYSLGVVMYQMLTADLPFKADTTMEMLLAHMQKQPMPIPTAHPELQVPENVAALALRLLEKNRDMRPATARVLIQEIEKLEKELAEPGATRFVPPDELIRTMQQRGPTGGPRPPVVPEVPPQRPKPPQVRPPDPPKVVAPPVAPPLVSQIPQVVVPPVHERTKPPESRWGIWVGLIILLVGIGAGGLWFATRTSTGTMTASISADPTTVQKGDSVTLHWTSQNATSLNLEPGVGPVEAQGSKSLTPDASTTYKLTATGPSGTQTFEAPVSVIPPPSPQPTSEHTTERTDEPTRPHHTTQIVHTTYKPPVHVVDPHEVKGKISLGDFYYKRGEYGKAITAYQEGLNLDPSNAELHQKLDETIKACKKENAILGESLNCG
ncbi:MAG: protein kinase [Terriglobia bacterium]|jgi:serine/threonine-protein kinase